MKAKIGTLIALVIKAPKLLKLFKAIKLFKFAKPAITMASIVISIGAYAIMYNPLIAVGLVVVILVHEMGHVFAMNKEGFKTSGPVFIPFLGAALFAPKNMDRRQEAVIGIGGPILGSLFSFLLVGLYFLTDAKWLLMMGYFGIFINIFNMIPITPLDGGRVTQAVGKYFKLIGMVLLIAASIALKNPGILLIWIIVFFDFNFLPIKTRFALACLVEIAMITILATGFAIENNEIFWATAIDAGIGGVYLALLGTGIFKNAKEVEEIIDEGSKRPEMSSKDKLKWFFVWLVTGTILYIALLLLEGPLKLIMIS